MDTSTIVDLMLSGNASPETKLCMVSAGLGVGASTRFPLLDAMFRMPAKLLVIIDLLASPLLTEPELRFSVANTLAAI